MSSLLRFQAWRCRDQPRLVAARCRRRAAAGIGLPIVLSAAWLLPALPAAAQAGFLPVAAAVSDPVVGAGGGDTATAADPQLLAMLAPAPAAPGTPDQAPASAPPAPAKSEGLLDRLTFHAYVNQAYAISDHHQIVGIPTTGTTDYRTVALQFRYALSAADAVVAQVANFRLGDSPINQLHGDVELEYGFYQHTFSDGTSVKGGKMPLPLGIYNEIRDVGTLLPFYAPPEGMYLELYSSRDLEGAMASHSFDLGANWGIDADLFGGGWEFREEVPVIGLVTDARAEQAAGGEVWLNTPISGLRVGAGYVHFDLTHGLSQVHAHDPHWNYHVSVDASFDRFYVRSEMYVVGQPTAALGPATEVHYRAVYAQAGYNLTRALSLNLQVDVDRLDYSLGAGYANYNTDYAASLIYKFRPSIAVKIESHRNRGQTAEFFPATADTRTNYGILSLAVSF